MSFFVIGNRWSMGTYLSGPFPLPDDLYDILPGNCEPPSTLQYYIPTGDKWSGIEVDIRPTD